MANPTTANTYSLPSHLSTPHDQSSTPTSSSSARKKLKERFVFLSFSSPHPSSKTPANGEREDVDRGGEEGNGRGGKSKGGKKWWHMLGKGMINDVKRRAPFYRSDWVDAWDYRVVPATVYMYFAKWVFSFLSY